MTATPDQSGRGPSPLFAWAVHLLTACGAVLALLALAAIGDREWRLALFWLFAALAIDGIDGTLARRARVKEKAPRIDGEALDLIIDYLTYVFVPTIFIWRAGLIPENLALWLAAAIQVSSLYVFVRRDMKTEDNYFRGFPALWNLVAFYLFVVGTSPAAGGVVVAVLAALTFAPIHFVHPFRVRDYGIALPAIATVWAAATCTLLWPDLPGSIRELVLIISLATAAVLLAMGLVRSVRGPCCPVRNAAMP